MDSKELQRERIEGWMSIYLVRKLLCQTLPQVKEGTIIHKSASMVSTARNYILGGAVSISKPPQEVLVLCLCFSIFFFNFFFCIHSLSSIWCYMIRTGKNSTETKYQNANKALRHHNKNIDRIAPRLIHWFTLIHFSFIREKLRITASKEVLCSTDSRASPNYKNYNNYISRAENNGPLGFCIKSKGENLFREKIEMSSFISSPCGNLLAMLWSSLSSQTQKINSH